MLDKRLRAINNGSPDGVNLEASGTVFDLAAQAINPPRTWSRSVAFVASMVHAFDFVAYKISADSFAS